MYSQPLAVTGSWDDGRERRPHRSPQRLTAAVLLGISLFSAAYRGAQAGGTPAPNYGDGGSGGGGTGAAAAVGVGAVAVAAAAGLFGGGAAAAGAAAGAAGAAGAAAAAAAGIPAASLALGPRGQLLPLPADVLCVTDVRLVPDQATIYAGTSQEFDLLARSFTDGKWYRATDRAETRFELDGDAGVLVQVSGSRATFAVPAGMAQGLAGKTFRLRARLTLPEQEPLTSEVEIVVRSAPTN